MLAKIPTRFRAYQLGNPGSSFSYRAGNYFTLIEGRATELSWHRLVSEMRVAQRADIDTVHLTSWDGDHCEVNQLAHICMHLRPQRVEIPGYTPHCDSAWESWHLVDAYLRHVAHDVRPASVMQFTPQTIASLPYADTFGYSDIILHPKVLYPDSSNNNSTIKLFRSGCFTVLSLGDVEDPEIANYLMTIDQIRNEVDVLLMAHHGADNGFTTERLIRTIKPRVAIASSDYDNQHEHPADTVRDIMTRCEVPLFTTKTGDVLIESFGEHTGQFMVRNLVSDSTRQAGRTLAFYSKRYINQLVQTVLRARG